MRKTAFVLLEIMIALVAIGIIVTLGFPAYQNIVEDSKAKVCDTNLKALQNSLTVYAMEHDTMPASLSQIPREYIKKAYAGILKENGAWKIKLAHFFINLDKKGLAYAAFLKDDIAKGDIKLITCPRDSNPSATHGSYGVNGVLTNINSQDYQNLSAGTLIVGDCVNATFTGVTELAERHKHYTILGQSDTYAQVVDIKGKVKEEDDGQIKNKEGKGKDEEEDKEKEKSKNASKSKSKDDD
jgi:competence protein ComGC